MRGSLVLEFKTYAEPSIHTDLADQMLGIFIAVLYGQPQMLQPVRHDLVKITSEILPLIGGESRHAIDKYMGNPSDRVFILLYSTVVQLASAMGSRVSVGPELGRNEEWMHIFANHSVALAHVVSESAK